MNSHLIALAIVLALFTSSATARDVQEIPELVNEAAIGNYILSIPILTFCAQLKFSLKVAQLR